MKNELLKGLEINTGHNELLQWGIIIVGAFLLFYICDFIGKKIIAPAVQRFTRTTSNTWDDILLNNDTIKNLCRLVPVIIANIVLPFILEAESSVMHYIHIVVQALQ